MKSSEQINRTYDLKQTSAEILLHNRSVRAPMTVSLELSPRPQLVLGYELSSTDARTSNEINALQQVSIRLDTGITIGTKVGNRWHLGGGKVSNILIPETEPFTAQDDKVSLERCRFALVNFPNMWGAKDITRYRDPQNRKVGRLYPHFHLEAHPWVVKIFGVESLMSVHYQMIRRGGSALTHIGTITNNSGQGFRVSELQSFLEALHLFLSFARGSYCGLTLLSGYDSNRDRVWEQWGTHKVEPWRRELQTWADSSSSHMLTQVFEGLWKLLRTQGQRDTISKVIHWYLRSNESIEPEVSIVVTHAALERLAFSTAGSMRRPRSVTEGDWIDQALTAKGIKTGISNHCPELRRLQRVHGWSHGPHGLVDIRNDLIHPDSIRGPFSTSALLEAQCLGLHYVELMLLQQSGYIGQYVNRLKSAQSPQSQIETVPWALAKSSVT